MDQKSSKPLHLLRAILRECTYLPDQNARGYIHKYALLRFQRYRNPKDLPPSRRTHLLQKARKGLSVLRRANEGYIGPLQRVLCATYGRIGRRRRLLMAEIMTPQVNPDPAAVSTLELAPKYDDKWKPSDLFQALLNSQIREGRRFDRNVRGKASLNLKSSWNIPEKNIWGQPMPSKRAKNMKRKWYTKSADSLLPPLPDHEWQRLRQLACGEIHCLDAKPRRKAVQAPSVESHQLLKDDFLVSGPRNTGLNLGDPAARPHKITERFMQRRYEFVLMHTPMASWDGMKNQWKVTWLSKSSPDGFPCASELQKSFFFSDDMEKEMT